MKSETCLTCKVRFDMTDDTHIALRQSRATFYCPWGHTQYYPAGPTEADTLRAEADKLRKERDRLKQNTAYLEDRVRAEQEHRAAVQRQASALKGVATRMKNRAAAGVCPCCNRTFSQLQRHMAAKHPAFRAEALPTGATVQ